MLKIYLNILGDLVNILNTFYDFSYISVNIR